MSAEKQKEITEINKDNLDITFDNKSLENDQLDDETIEEMFLFLNNKKYAETASKSKYIKSLINPDDQERININKIAGLNMTNNDEDNELI